MTQEKDSTRKGTAVITGASAGIGRMYAERLAERGYDLILVARREQLLQELGRSLTDRFGGAVRTVVADLSHSTQLESLASEIADDPDVTMLVNNAGTSTLGPVADTLPASILAMNSLNIDALVRLSAAVLPGFKQRDAGTIINIGSVLGFASLPISTVYSATKAYVTMFTRGLQAEVTGSNVRVQLVAPAATATDIWEISGVPLSALDPETVMSVQDMVEASLRGLDAGEAITMPSVEGDRALIDAIDGAALALLGASQRGLPAARYLAA